MGAGASGVGNHHGAGATGRKASPVPGATSTAAAAQDRAQKAALDMMMAATGGGMSGLAKPVGAAGAVTSEKVCGGSPGG